MISFLTFATFLFWCTFPLLSTMWIISSNVVSFFFLCYCRQLLSLPQIFFPALFYMYWCREVPTWQSWGTGVSFVARKLALHRQEQKWNLFTQSNATNMTTTYCHSRRPGKQVWEVFLWSIATKLQQTILGTGASSCAGLLEVFTQAFHGTLPLFHPCWVVIMITVSDVKVFQL